MFKFCDDYWNSQFRSGGLIYDAGWKNFREYMDVESDGTEGGRIINLLPDDICVISPVFENGKFEKGTYMIHKERVYITIEEPCYYV